MKITTSTTINAPRAKVFSVFTDFKNAADRLAGIQKMEFLEKDGEPIVGMKWRETRIMFGKEATEEMWITEINQDQNYVVEAESHGTHYRSEYMFADHADGTEVIMTFEGKPITWMASVGSLLMIFFAGSVKKALAADMSDLKQFIEGQS